MSSHPASRASSARLDAIEASSTALIETLADLQDRSAFASARASIVAALLARSAGSSSSAAPMTAPPSTRCLHPLGSSGAAPSNTASPSPGAAGNAVIAILYDDLPGNAPEDQRRGIRVLVGSCDRPNPVDERTVVRLETLAAALPSDDGTLPRYLFFDFDCTLTTTSAPVPWVWPGETPAPETLKRFDAPPPPATASWQRRHRLAAVLRKLRQHDRAFIVTSNPAIAEIAGMLNLLMDTEVGAGARFVAGDTVVLAEAGRKCDSVRGILATRGLAVHVGPDPCRPATAQQATKASPTLSGAPRFDHAGSAGGAGLKVTDCGIDGLSLYEELVTPEHQTMLLAFTTEALAAGRRGELAGKTFTQPSAQWAQLNKSREMLQYGVYTNSNRVQHTVDVLPLPPVLEGLVDLLVAAGVFPAANRPDTCVINVYSTGMWLPPHVDSDAFARPFCTVSLLSDQDVVFGDKITGAEGEFAGAVRVRMARGSVLRLDGHAAGPVCLHAIPRVTGPRISITLRRLSEVSKASFAADERERLERKRRRWTAKREAKLAAKKQ